MKGTPGGGSPFSRRALGWIIGVSSVSLLVGLAFLALGGGGDEPSQGSDSFSRSALGHRGLVQLLRELDVPVVVSRWQSGARAGHGVLLLAEPRAELGDLEVHIAAAPTTLLVLPKRYGTEDPAHPGWIRDDLLLGPAAAERTLRAAGLHATEVVRGGAADGMSAAPALQGHSIALADVQLVSSTELDPLLGGAGGMLIGERRAGDHRLVVLSDPDLIANHGLGDGDNAGLAVALIDELRDGGAVVFDEVLHGFERQSSLLRMMFSFPWVLLPLGLGIAVAALLWAGTSRFGAPLPPPATVARGKRALIDNTAELLRSGGHTAHVIDRYLRTAMGDVGQRLHAGAQVHSAALSGWLARAGRARNVSIDLERLSAEVAALARAHDRLEPRALATARAIHRWRQEMIDGSRRNTRD